MVFRQRCPGGQFASTLHWPGRHTFAFVATNPRLQALPTAPTGQVSSAAQGG